MRLAEERVGILWVESNHQAAVPAGCDRHVVADEKGETSEHFLLSYLGFARYQASDAVGEIPS
jgi:hypothetical protein